jgi:hypothetical protein
MRQLVEFVIKGLLKKNVTRMRARLRQLLKDMLILLLEELLLKELCVLEETHLVIDQHHLLQELKEKDKPSFNEFINENLQDLVQLIRLQ